MKTPARIVMLLGFLTIDVIAQLPHYQIVTLGSNFRPIKINNPGQILGEQRDNVITNKWNPCIRNADGSFDFIDTLQDGSIVSSIDFNDNGVVLVNSYLLGVYNYYTWDRQNGLIEIPSFFESYGGENFYLSDFNNSKQMTGVLFFQGGASLVFRTNMLNDTKLFGDTHSPQARFINDNGQVLYHTNWESMPGMPVEEYYLWDENAGIQSLFSSSPLPWPPIGYVYVSDMNNNVQVVGTRTAEFFEEETQQIVYENHAFIWNRANYFQDIRIGYESNSCAINDFGVVVGHFYDEEWNTLIGAGLWGAAFIWSEDVGWLPLKNQLINAPDEPNLFEAYDINNVNQIIGRGVMGYYLLNPVPEPNVYTLTIQANPSFVTAINPAAGQYSYQGGIVNIEAEQFIHCPDIYQFDHWEGDVEDPNIAGTSIVMDADKTVTAFYVLTGPACGDECHPNFLTGDLNHDCMVDLGDISIVASRWLNCTKPECD